MSAKPSSAKSPAKVKPPPTKVVLARADAAAVSYVFSQLEPQLQTGLWLAKQNRYRTDVVNKIRGAAGQLQRHKGLLKYIAASAPLHCADAARYLGRALMCLAVNDVHSSRHFAYYGELRAAMSVLACAGIGVFDNLHVVVVANRKVELTGNRTGTHRFVWEAFSEWALGKHALKVVGSGVIAAGQTIDDFVTAAPGGYTMASLVPRWLKHWGLDLQEKDRDRRNESSYRPSDINPVASCGVTEIRDYLSEFWRVFDPTLRTRFDVIDEQLLRSALEDIRGCQGSGITLGDMTSMFGKLGLVVGANPRLEAVLQRTGGLFPDSMLFELARKAPKHEDPRLHFSMISRAAFLMRLAFAAVSMLVFDSGLNPQDYLPWLNAYGSRAGIWSSAPADFIDLWPDISDALTKISESPAPADVYSWTRSDSEGLLSLGEFERVATWGLAS